jgi:glutamate synthase (NADPH/NADH) large chain
VAFETLEDIRIRKGLPLSQGDEEELHQGGGQGHPEGDVQDGHLTYQSYCGAQIFDAIGLSSAFIDKYFTGTATTIEGAA